MGESRSYRKFSAQQKTELVLASLRGPKTIAQLCREHDISESLLRKWREQFLAAGAERLSGKARSAPRPTSCAGRSAGSSARWAARRWRWRSRGNSCGDGSEPARRPFPRTGRARPSRRASSRASPGSAARRSTGVRRKARSAPRRADWPGGQHLAPAAGTARPPRPAGSPPPHLSRVAADRADGRRETARSLRRSGTAPHAPRRVNRVRIRRAFDDSRLSSAISDRRSRLWQSGRGESNPHLWLGKPTSWPLDNAREGRGSVSDADTLADVRMRVFWPVTSPPRRSSGCSRTASRPSARTRRWTTRWPTAGGRTAPVMALPRLGGAGSASLADYKGKVVVLNVWASWCDAVPRGGAAAAEDARADRSRRAASCSGVDTQDARADALALPAASSRRRSRACATATAPTGASSA